MAVSLKVKKSAKSATVLIVDRMVELKRQIDAVGPAQKEFDKLVKELRAQAMEQDPQQVVTFDGTDHQVVFSEASMVRKLADMAAVKKAMGNELFMDVAKVSMADVDKYLTEDEVAKLVTSEPGPRRIEILDK